MFTEYDQEISDMLQDLNLDDAMIGYSRGHGGGGGATSSSTAAATSSSSAAAGAGAAGGRRSIAGAGVGPMGGKGLHSGSGSMSTRATGGRSRSLYFSAADMR
jgi:hypothetical protein